MPISKCPPSTPTCSELMFLDKTRSLTLPRQQRNRESALGGEGCVMIHRCRLRLCSTCSRNRPLTSFTIGDTAHGYFSNTASSWRVFRYRLLLWFHRLFLSAHRRFSACRVCTSPHVPPAASLLVAVQSSDHPLSRETDLHLLPKPEAQVLRFTPTYPVTGSPCSG